MIDIIGIEHIAIAVDNFKESRSFFKDILGVEISSSEKNTEQGVITNIYNFKNSKVEYIKPLEKKSKISKFLEKRGPGLHHICFHVRNIKDSIDYLKENNIKLIGNEYSIGAEGYKVIFIHPKSTGGILIELAEK
tara:strand:+ start:442 stop:846 length:405 start_codon:yes stop_codon:yes gene_type:complete